MSKMDQLGHEPVGSILWNVRGRTKVAYKKWTTCVWNTFLYTLLFICDGRNYVINIIQYA